MALRLTFHGTRGSIPVPGPSTVRYGGNTPCLVVESSEHTDRLILDAGTGLRTVPLDADTAPETTILLSHTHWDHIQGLPLTLPTLVACGPLRIIGPRPARGTLRSVLEATMMPALFPVPFPAEGNGVIVEEWETGTHHIGPFTVQTYPTQHPAPTLGFAVSITGTQGGVIYLTDNELGMEPLSIWRTGLIEFVRDCDILVHDAMLEDANVSARRGWGHSSAAEAVRLAAEAGCKRLVLFHHDPGHDDTTLDRLLDQARALVAQMGVTLDVTLAIEATTLTQSGDT